LAQVENESGRKLKCLKSNNGGEYYDGIFEEFCVSRGIRRVKKIPKNSHQNEVAERVIDITILEPKQFWADAVNTTVYLINRGPSLPLNYEILEEAWTYKEVNLNHLCTFGCISYVHIELDRRSKLDLKSKRCIFIGYKTREYDYQFWDPEN